MPFRRVGATGWCMQHPLRHAPVCARAQWLNIRRVTVLGGVAVALSGCGGSSLSADELHCAPMRSAGATSLSMVVADLSSRPTLRSCGIWTARSQPPHAKNASCAHCVRARTKPPRCAASSIACARPVGSSSNSATPRPHTTTPPPQDSGVVWGSRLDGQRKRRAHSIGPSAPALRARSMRVAQGTLTNTRAGDSGATRPPLQRRLLTMRFACRWSR